MRLLVLLALLTTTNACQNTTYSPRLDRELTPAGEAYLATHSISIRAWGEKGNAFSDTHGQEIAGSPTVAEFWMEEWRPFPHHPFLTMFSLGVIPQPYADSRDVHLVVRASETGSVMRSAEFQATQTTVVGWVCMVTWLLPGWEYGGGGDFDERMFVTTINLLAAEAEMAGRPED